MEYLEKHIERIKSQYPPDNRYKVTFLASSSDGGGTIVSAIIKYRGIRYHFYRNELERA